MPPALPPAADPLLSADRRYQTAAAEFYAEEYVAAARDFGAIAGDVESPWREVGELMVARTLIREATVGEVEGKLTEARRALDGIIANPQRAKLGNAARGLRDFVTARLDPDGQILALSERLMRRNPGRNLPARWTTSPCCGTSGRRRLLVRPNSRTGSRRFKSRSWEHALERWRARPDDAWLVAALSSVPHDNPAVPELLAAAHGFAAAVSGVGFRGVLRHRSGVGAR